MTQRLRDTSEAIPQGTNVRNEIFFEIYRQAES